MQILKSLNFKMNIYMNMFFHNLKVALRNLLKYKVQTMGSILSLAIGMVTLAVMHSLLLNARARAISDEAYVSW